MDSNITKFSVLMSVYNKDNAVWVKQALDSVINQTSKPSEILIAQDGPIDHDLEKLLLVFCEHPGVKLIKFKENRGRGAVLMDTLPLCENELVALMDSDDISLPHRFEKQIELFSLLPDLDISGGYIREVDSLTLKPLSIRKVPLKQEEIRQFIKTRSPINQVTVMFKKSSIIKIGGYSSEMRFAQDYHLWIRAVAKGLNIQNIPEILVDVRIDPAMFGRRGGYKYFKLNKTLQDQLLKHKLIGRGRYLLNIALRFTVQVLMPAKGREMLYNKILRNGV